MYVNPYIAGAGRTPAYLAGREQIIANTAQSFETSERIPHGTLCVTSGRHSPGFFSNLCSSWKFGFNNEMKQITPLPQYIHRY